MKLLVTGAAGFLGMHTAQRLLAAGHSVVGIDNLNPYYDVQLKRDRLAQLAPYPNFTFIPMDIADRDAMEHLFADQAPQRVIHLAAQAGVRYSLINPHAYIESNIQGFMNILEGCRRGQVEHLVYASSSSVYGGNTRLPFSEHDTVDHPVSLYAATKKSNELMAHTYSHLFGLPTTGLRFFTVYGPWGRPDMALFLFTKAILDGRPIDVFNNGQMTRGFTYVDDIIEGIVRVMAKPAQPDPQFDTASPDSATSNAPYRIFNIGSNQPTSLMAYIEALEQALGKSAEKVFCPMQPGDVSATAADTQELESWIGFKPNTPIGQGISNFITWYRGYYL